MSQRIILNMFFSDGGEPVIIWLDIVKERYYLTIRFISLPQRKISKRKAQEILSLRTGECEENKGTLIQTAKTDQDFVEFCKYAYKHSRDNY